MPYAAIHYGAYEHYRAALLTAADRVGATQWLTSPATAHHAMRVSPIVDLLAGSGAGESAALLCNFWQGSGACDGFYLSNLLAGPGVGKSIFWGAAADVDCDSFHVLSDGAGAWRRPVSPRLLLCERVILGDCSQHIQPS